MTLLFEHSGRDDKTPSERFHSPEVILESEGGSGRVVGKQEAIQNGLRGSWLDRYREVGLWNAIR
jgi:hypothetical protein